MAETVEQVAGVEVVFRLLRRQRERAVDRLECLLRPTAQHLRRRQQAKDRIIAGIEGDGVGNDLDRFVAALRAQQELGRMDRIRTLAGCERVGAQRQLDRLRRLVEGKGSRREAAEHPGVVGHDPGGAAQMKDGLAVAARGRAETAGVNREFERAGLDFAGLRGVKNRAIDVPGNGTGAARMAVAGRPSGAAFDEDFIGRRGLAMALAIAEQPSAKICCRRLPGFELESGAGVGDRFVALAAVIKCLAQTTPVRRLLARGNLAGDGPAIGRIEAAGIARGGR